MTPARSLFWLKSIVLILCGAILSGCALRHDQASREQFGAAVRAGDVALAKATVRRGFANMPMKSGPSSADKAASSGKDAQQGDWVPMQYAISQENKPMADFLLSQGAKPVIHEINLAYYSAFNGHEEMARYFVSRNIGTPADIRDATMKRKWRLIIGDILRPSLIGEHCPCGRWH